MKTQRTSEVGMLTGSPALAGNRCVQRVRCALVAIAGLALVGTLTGCAGPMVIDSQVQTFAKFGPIPAGASYRFERLPSQQQAEPQQSQVETMAAVSLGHVGLRYDEAKPMYTAQVSARVTPVLVAFDNPFYGPGFGPGLSYGAYGGWGGWGGYGGYGGGWYGPQFPPSPWFEREVNVILREQPGGKVVYETSARNDGPYSASGLVLSVLFDAALQGFPNPPSEVRQVRTEVPLMAPAAPAAASKATVAAPATPVSPVSPAVKAAPAPVR